jgi:hypothetical protein
VSSRWYKQPWQESDCRLCAERLKKNESALTQIAAAVRRPRYFVPLKQGHIFGVAIPSLLPVRLAANAIAGRGMLSVGRKQFEAARADALTLQRLAVLQSQGPTLIERLIAIAVRGIGAPLVPLAVTDPSLSRDAAREFLRQLLALPRLGRVVDTLDDLERLALLDEILLRRQRAAERGMGSLVENIEPEWRRDSGDLPADQLADVPDTSEPGHPAAYLLPVTTIDWNETLRMVNHGFDVAVAGLRADSDAGAASAQVTAEIAKLNRGALELLRRSVHGEGTRAADIAATAQAMARSAAGRRLLAVLVADAPDLHRASIAENEIDALFRIDVDTVALAVHRLEAGRYPDDIAALTPELLPARFTQTPASGYQVTYASAQPISYALTAVPVKATVTGNRGFCVDSAGFTRITIDGSAPRIVNGLCDPKAALLR